MTNSRLPNRRRFLKMATATAATAWLAPCAGARQPPGIPDRPVRLGMPLFEAPEDPERLALAHRKLGLRAAYCPPVSLDDTQRIRDIRRAFEKHDVMIAEVGRWKNLLAADSDQRKRNLQFVTEGLALADQVGARCCVDIAGSYNRDSWFGPDPDNVSQRFFDAAVENARKIIDSVKPKHARFCFEVMGWALPDSPDAYLQLVKAVDRKAFAVHLDPCNLINSPRRFYDNTKLLNECFDKLGPWIVSCHAKDVTWDVEMQVHFRETVIGTGHLDYTTYLKRLAILPDDVPLMIEHMKDAKQYDQSRQYLLDLGRRIGVQFG